jgi:CubicO group peptidase (beta-lactamase class C family)
MLLEEIERRVTGKLSSNSTMNQILSTVLRAESCEAGGGGQPSSGQASNTVQGWAGQSQFFCSARDLSALAQMLLNGGIYGHQRILKRSTVELFTARQRVGDAVRALGWAVGPWNGGPLSRRAFGSDGPSGASFWVDPEKRLFVIFLPAEVRPGAEENLRALREQLHRQAADLLGAASAAQ